MFDALARAHALCAQEKPVLLYECEEHIREGLKELDSKFDAEEKRIGGSRKDDVVHQIIVPGDAGLPADVHLQLRRQIERVKIFELPLQCIIKNFKLVGPILERIASKMSLTRYLFRKWAGEGCARLSAASRVSRRVSIVSYLIFSLAGTLDTEEYGELFSHYSGARVKALQEVS